MQYIKVKAPKKKADWRDKMLRLNEAPPACQFDVISGEPKKSLPIMVGDVAKIYMRRKFGDQNWYMPN